MGSIRAHHLTQIRANPLKPKYKESCDDREPAGPLQPGTHATRPGSGAPGDSALNLHEREDERPGIQHRLLHYRLVLGDQVCMDAQPASQGQ